MSITRRQFLLSIPITAIGLTIPTFFTRSTENLEITGWPLLVPPTQDDVLLFAVADGARGYQLNIGDPYADPPSMTLREYIDTYFWGDDSDYMEEAELDINTFKAALNDTVDEEYYLEQWCRFSSPGRLAYDYLECLDLGPESGGNDGIGLIEFIDGASPGNDYIGVHVPDYLSLGLLQEKLKELNEGAKIVIYT